MLIIFDLDGTLTPRRASPTDPFERRLLPGVEAKCRELNDQGHVLTVATNQRQLMASHALYRRFQAHMRWLTYELGLSGHAIASTDREMKPRPILLYRLMGQFGFDATETLLIGDSDADMKAALAAGVRFQRATDFFGREAESDGGD